MTMILNERSLKNLEGVHADLVRVLHRAAEICSVPFVVTEGLRNLKRQKELKAAGKSWTLDSRHLTGHAVDVVDANDFKYDIPDLTKIAAAMKQASRELDIPIVWGGDWKQRDTPHFELDKRVYPASGVGAVTKIKEAVTKVATSKPALTVAGGAVGSSAVPTNSMPSPPDLSYWSNWKGFGETLASLGGWAWQNLALTALLGAVLLALWLWPKPAEAS